MADRGQPQPTRQVQISDSAVADPVSPWAVPPADEPPDPREVWTRNQDSITSEAVVPVGDLPAGDASYVLLVPPREEEVAARLRRRRQLKVAGVAALGLMIAVGGVRLVQQLPLGWYYIELPEVHLPDVRVPTVRLPKLPEVRGPASPATPADSAGTSRADRPVAGPEAVSVPTPVPSNPAKLRVVQDWFDSYDDSLNAALDGFDAVLSGADDASLRAGSCNLMKNLLVTAGRFELALRQGRENAGGALDTDRRARLDRTDARLHDTQARLRASCVGRP
jgi:hypothetical protein